jgi:hypothetical protein
MQASNFEYRHQTLLHQLVIAAALLTYLFDRDDIVWRFVKNSTAPRVLERILFIAATLAVVLGAGICTWTRAHFRFPSSTGGKLDRALPRSQFFGDVLYAIGLASLFPLTGFVLLVAGETLRLLRLARGADDRALERETGSGWGRALRKEAAKLGIAVTMASFSITLTDRLAEYMAAGSFLIGLLLNLSFFSHLPSEGESI